MDFSFSEEQERFRKEVRDFLEKEILEGSFEIEEDGWMWGFSPEFSRKVGQRGWIGLTWPKEYGGQGRSYLDRLVYTEEMLRYGAPVAAHWLGDRQVGPALIRHGSEEQKREFLPRIIRGEISFALGMSERGAGSDVASLQTQAVGDGDDYIISGQKVWSSLAHIADYYYLFARTDPDAPKHRGLSEFLIEMKLPGITVQPLIDVAGAHRFNEVFLDQVRVSQRALIGQENRGWYQLAAQLDYERSGIERLMSNYPLLQNAIKHFRESQGRWYPAPEQLRHKLAELLIEFEVGRLLIYRVAWVLTQERTPNYEAALAKAYCTGFEQRLTHTAMQVYGLFGQLMPGSPEALLKGRPAKNYLTSRAYTLAGGTSEILRNIVAVRGLGLPAG